MKCGDTILERGKKMDKDDMPRGVLLKMQEVVSGILNGTYDDLLETIIDAIDSRKGTIAEIKALSLTVGDRVRMVKVRPKYLAGTEGVIKAKGKGKFELQILDLEDLDPRIKKFLTDEGTLFANANILETVNKGL